jgi:hypothetical protein
MINARALIVVDPGLSGGFAWRNAVSGIVYAEKMPSTIKEMYDFLEDFKPTYNFPIVMLMEKVGKHRLGNSAQSSATFAKHVGHLEMAMIAHGIPTYEVAATKWMNEIVPGRPKGVEGAQVRARKNYIKDQMQRHHPHLKVTLATADALGILEYLIRNQDQY